MAEATVAKKEKAVPVPVTMEDGRVVEFTGKKKVDKTIVIDSSKVVVDGDSVIISKGGVGVRFDYLNGQTRLFEVPLSLLAYSAGHGLAQKQGDELATTADKPLSIEDMVAANEDLQAQLEAGNWRQPSEGGGAVAGASIVIRALVEASGKSVEVVKAFLQGKLDKAKAAGEKLSRNDLYNSFRKEGTKTAAIIERMEKEERAKSASKVDADASLSELSAA